MDTVLTPSAHRTHTMCGVCLRDWSLESTPAHITHFMSGGLLLLEGKSPTYRAHSMCGGLSSSEGQTTATQDVLFALLQNYKVYLRPALHLVVAEPSFEIIVPIVKHAYLFFQHGDPGLKVHVGLLRCTAGGHPTPNLLHGLRLATGFQRLSDNGGIDDGGG